MIFVQWLDTEQSQQAKDHVGGEARWAAERWQQILHKEHMEEKRKKDQEHIQKRIEQVRRRRNMKLTRRGSERGPAVLRKQDTKLLGRGNIPGALSKALHHHVILAIYIP